MASPRAIGFTLFDVNGAPLPGQVPVFSVYCDETGVDIAPPAIIEIKGGGYYFVPVFNLNRDLYYLVDAGINAYPRYFSELLRYENFDVDLLPGIDANATTAAAEATIARKCGTNSRNVDALTKQEILLDDDGVTPFVRWNLFDDVNAPTTGPNIFKKTKL